MGDVHVTHQALVVRLVVCAGDSITAVAIAFRRYCAFAAVRRSCAHRSANNTVATRTSSGLSMLVPLTGVTSWRQHQLR
jgi:hypothetical protein